MSSLFDKKFHRIIQCISYFITLIVLVKLRNEIDACTFKAQLISGST